MKNSFRSIIAAILAFSMLLSLAVVFASCGTQEETTDATATTTTAPSTTAPVTTAPPAEPQEPVLDLGEVAGLADYTIVYPEALGDDAYGAAVTLRDSIFAVTGVELPLVSDAVVAGGSIPSDTKEILIGATNRAESAAASALLRDDYRLIFSSNGRYALLAGSEEALCAAISYVITNLLGDGKLSYVIGGYAYYAKYPIPLTISGTSIGKYTIVRDAENAAVAAYLRDVIADLTGSVLPIITNEDPERAYEILIGNTGRTETARAVADEHYVMGIDGTKVVLYGNGDLNPAYYATINFINEYLTGEFSEITLRRTEYDNSLSGMTSVNLPDELGAITLEKTENTGGVFERFLKAKDELPTEVTVLDRVLLSRYPLSARRVEVYVAEDGDDANPGTFEAPVATIERALKIVGTGGGVIWMRGGTYMLNKTINVTSIYSGTATCPLFIKAYEGETPVITTYKTIKPEWFDYVDEDDEVALRLPDEAYDEVMYVDLADYGFTMDDVTELVADSDGYDVNGDGVYRETRYGAKSLLIIGNKEYEIARYPNADDEPLSFSHAYDSGRVTSSTGSEIYYTWIERCAVAQMDPLTPLPWSITLGERNKDERSKGVAIEDTANWERYAPILDWVDTGNIWFYGRPYSDWDVGAFNVHVGKQLDEDGNEIGVHTWADGRSTDYAITSTMPSSLGAYTHGDKSKATHAHHYYLFNAIEALDIPGEWFLDVESEGLRLYIYPPDEWWEGDIGDILYTSSCTDSAFTLNNLSYTVFDGLTFRGLGASGIYDGSASSQLNNIVVQNCDFSHMGNYGVALGSLPTNIAIIYNHFSQSHGGMVTLTNRAYRNMIPDHNVIQNNTFEDPTPNHESAVQFQGCVSIVSHNYFHNTVIQFSQSYESIVEYNEMIGGSKDVGDGGQIYTYGVNSRGNHIRYNRCHGLNFSGNNIYNDGMGSGNYSYYNICSTLTGYRDVTQKCFYVSTGHNNVCYNNLFVTRSYERCQTNILSVTGKAATMKNGDCGMYESTLFYADAKDLGYHNSKRMNSDSASYSWDELYRKYAQMYTGTVKDSYLDLEKFTARFPNFVDSMYGALAVFQLMDERGADYDRRTAQFEKEAAYETAVALFMGEIANTQEAIDAAYEEAFNTRWESYEAYWQSVKVDYSEEAQKKADAMFANGPVRGNPLRDDAEEIAAFVEKYGTNLTETEAEAVAFRLGYGYTEDFFRQPAYNVYRNNVILGGDASYYFDADADGIYGEIRADYVYSDYLSPKTGFDDFGNAMSSGNDPYSKDLRIIENNYYNPDYDEIVYDADPEFAMDAEYEFVVGAYETVKTFIPEFEDLTYYGMGLSEWWK